MKLLPPRALARTVLADLDRRYTLSEIVTITSAGPARALGLDRKGHLGVGADADVAIYPGRPDGGDSSSPRATSSRAARSWWRRDEIRGLVEGREFVVRPAYDAQVEEYLRPVFQQAYTMSFDNYPVEAERVHGMELADCRIRA